MPVGFSVKVKAFDQHLAIIFTGLVIAEKHYAIVFFSVAVSDFLLLGIVFAKLIEVGEFFAALFTFRFAYLQGVYTCKLFGLQLSNNVQ